MNMAYLDVTRTLLLGAALISLNFDSAHAEEEVGTKLTAQVEENDLSSAASKSDKTAGVQTVDAKAAKIDEPEKMVSTTSAPDVAAVAKL